LQSSIDDLSESFLIVQSTDEVARYLPNMASSPQSYILVMDHAPKVRAALACGKIVALMTNLNASRFPGDLAPQRITFGHVVDVDQGEPFRCVEWSELQLNPALTLAGFPASLVLICQKRMPWRLIPAEHFDSLKHDASSKA
jgi:hypothetical protein